MNRESTRRLATILSIIDGGGYKVMGVSEAAYNSFGLLIDKDDTRFLLRNNPLTEGDYIVVNRVVDGVYDRVCETNPDSLLAELDSRIISELSIGYILQLLVNIPVDKLDRQILGVHQLDSSICIVTYAGNIYIRIYSGTVRVYPELQGHSRQPFYLDDLVPFILSL